MSLSTQIRARDSPMSWDAASSSATPIGSSVEAPAPSNAVAGVNIRGGRFNNSASANNNLSLSLFNLMLGPRDYAAPGGTQPEFPSVVYSRLLLPKACGFPLYDPRPPPWLNDEYTREGVDIGDVGIVTTEGSFDFLFNIRYAADHPINRGGVPPCFSPPEWATSTASLPQDGRDPGSYVAYGSIQVLESNRASGDYRFMGNAGEGAALVLPTSTRTARIPNTRQFRDYAAENAFAWYKFAEQLGRDAPNGSIYLITGWEKTPMWGTASFEGNRHDFELAYENGTWTHYGLASTKRGPRGVDAENPEPFNQCIFLSGYKMTLGESLWQRVLGTVEVSGVGNTAQKTSVLRGSSIFTRAPPVGSLARWTYPSEGARLNDLEEGADQSESGDVVLESIDPSTLLDVHPSNLINRFLLSKVPSAEVAITHDSVWCSLINDAHTPFEAQLTAMYTITVQSGAVYLTEKSAKLSSEEFSASAGISVHDLPSPASTTQNPLLEPGTMPRLEVPQEKATRVPIAERLRKLASRAEDAKTAHTGSGARRSFQITDSYPLLRNPFTKTFKTSPSSIKPTSFPVSPYLALENPFPYPEDDDDLVSPSQPFGRGSGSLSSGPGFSPSSLTFNDPKKPRSKRRVPLETGKDAAEGKPYKCPVSSCDKVFLLISEAQLHYQIHGFEPSTVLNTDEESLSQFENLLGDDESSQFSQRSPT